MEQRISSRLEHIHISPGCRNILWCIFGVRGWITLSKQYLYFRAYLFWMFAVPDFFFVWTYPYSLIQNYLFAHRQAVLSTETKHCHVCGVRSVRSTFFISGLAHFLQYIKYMSCVSWGNVAGEEKKGGGIGDALPCGQTCTRWRKQLYTHMCTHSLTHTHTHMPLKKKKNGFAL